jgi:hypothetical protein
MASGPKNWWNIENAEDDESRKLAITLFLKDVYNSLNKGLTIQDHMRGAILSVTFTALNTDTRIGHGLNFVPTNFIVVHQSANIGIYEGSSATNQAFYLKAGVATGTARVFLF